MVVYTAGVSGAFRFVLVWCAVVVTGTAELPEVEYHLTAMPWSALGTPRSAYLDVLEGICRFTSHHQDQSGAIIDPFLRREHQYATPYYAYAVATLAAAGRARDLLPSGVAAMNHATLCMALGREGIPDRRRRVLPGLAGGSNRRVSRSSQRERVAAMAGTACNHRWTRFYLGIRITGRPMV